MTLTLFIVAGLFLPLYPLSIPTGLLLQRRGGSGLADEGWPRPWDKAAAMVVLPLVGVGLVTLARSLPGGDDPRLLTGFAVWGGITSVLYAFRLLSARDGQIWISQLHVSALALIWVGLAHGVAPLLPALALSLSLLPLLLLLDELARRFGIARVGLYPGLSLRMPQFSLVFIGAVLAAVAIPLSPAFFAVADLAFGGVAANELVTLLPIGLSWLLWTWAGTNLLTGIVYGRSREDLTYRDLERRPLLAYAGALLALAVGGLVANGVML
jgi:NADH:ubiquinone oxidoreductase subunit 4 (subunit M)